MDDMDPGVGGPVLQHARHHCAEEASSTDDETQLFAGLKLDTYRQQPFRTFPRAALGGVHVYTGRVP